jgi:uncharacterized delta-60 repeat protein
MARFLTTAFLLLCASAAVYAQSAQDGFDPGTNAQVFAVAIQTDGKIVVGGNFTSIGGGGNGNTSRSRIARLNIDGTLDASFDPGASPSPVSALVVQPDEKILVGGYFNFLGGGGFGNVPRSKIGRLNSDGTVDTSFNPGANGQITAMLLQPDGKILIGGFFTMIGGGGTGNTARSRIARLNPDGSVDTTFNAGANNTVRAFALQRDGRIVVVGDFTNFGSVGTGTLQRRFIARLNSDGGLDTSFNPGANNTTEAVLVQVDGKIVVGGHFTGLGGGTGTTTRNFIGRVNPDGSVDSGFNPGADFFVSALALQSDGAILVGGLFNNLGGGGTGTTPRSHIGRLKPDGSVDTNFDPGSSGLPHVFAIQFDRKIIVGGAFAQLGDLAFSRANIARLYPDGSLDSTIFLLPNGPIFTVALQADGKILIGGRFSMIGETFRAGLARLHANGRIDQSFKVRALGDSPNAGVYAMAVQPDGKIVIGGEFSSVNELDSGGVNIPRNNIARINSNGTIDTSFNPGANGLVSSFAIQPDGKILASGIFTALGGLGTTPRSRVGRLNSDGSIDNGFDPGANAPVNSLALQRDDKILVGGNLTLIGGGGTGTIARNFIARLNSDGTVDMPFDPGANGPVSAFAIQPDDKIIVGGSFTTLGGGGTGTNTKERVGRLNSGGSLDTAFFGGANGPVQTVALQADGRVVVGGLFTTLGDTIQGTKNRNRIGRFYLTGSIDDSFDPGADAEVDGLAIQSDGKVIVVGGFETLGGQGGRKSIGRLTNTDLTFQRIFVHPLGTALAWSNLFASPEVARVTFESSTDGINFTSLGTASPPPPQSASAAWILNGLSLPLSQRLFLRGRGFYQTGQVTGSSSILEVPEDTLLCPAVTVGPASGALADVVVGTAYSQQFNQTGGVGPVSFSTSAGRLPNGVTLNSSTGLLSGTPTETGTFDFTIEASDQNGCFGTATYSLHVQCPNITVGPVPGPIANGTAGTPYSQQFTQIGGAGTITFTQIGGNLPTGLSLSPSGLLSGTPLQTGTFLFMVQAVDQNGCAGLSTYQLLISCPVITISPATTNLPTATAGSPYSITFSQTGGIAPIIFSTEHTIPPPGLSLNPVTGVLSGIPTQVQTFGFAVMATDAIGCTGLSHYSLQVKSGMRLSASAYSPSEGVNAVTITVNRFGDVSGPASVNYATSDTAGLTGCTVANGKASERCDYGTTLGTLRFDGGEASKSFIIPIVDDAIVEGNESFTVTLSDAVGTPLGTPQTATIVIVDNDAAPATQNPIDRVEPFVTQQYIDFLGRLPDTVGFANWVATLNGCPNGGFGEFDNPGCDRVHVSAGFFLSEEFQGRGYWAYRFYEVALDRRPTYVEFVPDMVRVGGAQSPASEALSKAAYTTDFLQRPDFKARYDSMSNADYVNTLEANAEVTLANKALIIQALDQNNTTRAQVLREIVESQAVADRFFNRAFVTMQYFGYLRRDPDTIGFQNWLNTLNADPNNFRHMIFGFLFSTEYRQRFGP